VRCQPSGVKLLRVPATKSHEPGERLPALRIGHANDIANDVAASLSRQVEGEDRFV
jgi:hypothetical protein